MGKDRSKVGRRGFLQAMIAGAAVDPERLLWIPGRKMISIPRRPERQRIILIEGLPVRPESRAATLRWMLTGSVLYGNAHVDITSDGMSVWSAVGPQPKGLL